MQFTVYKVYRAYCMTTKQYFTVFLVYFLILSISIVFYDVVLYCDIYSYIHIEILLVIWSTGKFVLYISCVALLRFDLFGPFHLFLHAPWKQVKSPETPTPLLDFKLR